MPVNYANGQIYVITCTTTGRVNVGSTAQKLLSNRISGHRNAYTYYTRQELAKTLPPVPGEKKKAHANYCRSFLIIEKDNYTYDTLEYYACANQKELEKREGHFITIYKAIHGEKCVNKNIPARSTPEYLKEYDRRYQARHSVRIKAHNAERIACELCGEMTGRHNIRAHQRGGMCFANSCGRLNLMCV
jgi:hypothetical protein